MAFETKEQVLEKIIAQERPVCPHCKEEMKLWEVPPVAFSDGLGWGTPYLYLCFNDDCPLYVQGWKNIQENYGHTSSYRCMCYPGTDSFECMPVFSSMGGTAQIIDEQVVAQQEVLKEAIKKGFSVLAETYVKKDWSTTLSLLMDPTHPVRVRVKAAEIVGDIGELDAIEPIRNHKFGNDVLQTRVNEAVKKIHERYFTRECPFCAEIIKKRADICKHCGREVAGQ